MQLLLGISAGIDRVLAFLGRIGSWAGVVLVFVVCYDVITRYFGVPKPFGLNSTQIQESEYWLHTFLFSLVLGYAYIRQAHVRIDVIRDNIPNRGKFLIEMLGCLCFLLPYCCLALYFTIIYAQQSYLEGEVSKSVIGLSNIWILKSAIPVLFVLLGLAGISQLIKSTAGFLGLLGPEREAEILGGDL
ncbi:MAG: TRAP transporter small permease subunit [Pseudomonadota bacterium]